MDLPAGLRSRPLRLTDAPAACAVAAAQEEHALGQAAVELADIVGDWNRPGFDVQTSTLGVFAHDGLIAHAEVGLAGRVDAAVCPEQRGRGLGTALARWLQDTARAKGLTVIGQPVPQGSAGDLLLAGLGYRVRWTSWCLELPAGVQVPPRVVPDGYRVRAAGADELERAWTVQEDAFLEWSVRERETFADWQAAVTGRPGFQPWQLRVVTGPDGDVVAMALLQMGGTSAFVARLATRRDHRGRGLAQALLVDAFAAGAEHGTKRFELSTDSRTGALGLYEKVGMVVSSVWVNRGIEL